jgi:hypothetical protein
MATPQASKSLDEALDECRLKLERASSFWQELDRAVKAFVSHDPFSIAVRAEDGGREHVHFVDRYTTPPPEIAVIIGDFIHDARCSLDYLVNVAAERGAARQGHALTPQQRRGLQFPIAKKPSEFRRAARTQLAYTSPDFQAFVESKQPYHEGNQPRNSLLVIQRLSNEDKHRQLHILGAAVNLLGRLPVAQWPQQLRDMLMEPTFDMGAEVIRLVFSVPLAADAFPLDYRFSVAVEGVPGDIVTELVGVSAAVADILSAARE